MAAEANIDLLGYDGLVPEEMTNFVGRDDEIRAARELLLRGKKRLVTLVGTPGVGKSRLAGELGRGLLSDGAFPDGVHMIRLEDVSPSAEEIASSIAVQVQLGDNASEPALARLIKHFQNKRVLLLLDSCEHLVVGAGPLPRLISVLLGAARNLCVVATSRTKTGCPRERVMNIQPLRVEEALEVLFDTAASIDQPITDAEQLLARRLCEAIDSIPRAVMLAAKRLDVQTLQELVDRAEAGDLLPALVDGSPEQRLHRSMAGEIARSHEVLDKTEQLVFGLLSVFRGGFDLDAAVAIGAEFDVGPTDVEDAIVRLVRLSLLMASNFDGRKRFRMVEVIRQFAQQQVYDGPIDAAALHEAHNRYCSEFIKRARCQWFGPDEPTWMRSISINLPNYRTVQERLLAHPDSAQLGLELALNATATRAFVFGGRLNESRRMLEAGLATRPAEPSHSQVAALALTLWVAVLQGEQKLASSLLEQVEAAARELDCWETFGPVLYARATQLGLNASTPAQFRDAQDLFARAEDALFEEGSKGDEFMAALFRAISAAFGSDAEAASAHSSRVLAAAQVAKSKWCISWGLWVCALAELIHGDNADRATRLAREALDIQLAIGDRWGPTWSLWLLALCAINDGDYKRGALLLGGADREQATTQTSVAGLHTFLRAQQKFVAIARDALKDGPFDEHRATGFTCDPKESFDLALDETEHKPALQSEAAALPELSGRELEVARLIAQGKTNAKIAKDLYLSERTVEGHVGKINAKIGTNNRTEIAAHIIRHFRSVTT